MIGERVRHARTYHGWSQKHLADLCGVSQPRVNQVESGAPASEELLAKIAEVTQFARWWFDLGPLPDLPAGSLRFRKGARTPLRDDERIRASVRQAIEVVERLSTGVRLPEVRLVPEPREPSELGSDEIEAVAARTRELLGIGPYDPVPNVVRAIERSGTVVVTSAHEVQRHDAASFWPDYPYGRPIIYMSRHFPGDRQRFNVSHELGHLVLHQLRQVDDPKVAEGEAHRFAGALLIPRDVVLDELSSAATLNDLAYVKARWGISIAALIYRCLDLGLITPDRRASLQKQLSARGWRRSEPVTVVPEVPLLVSQLIAKTVGSIAPSQLVSTIGLPTMASRDLVA
jgi:Zn-dependent peptidase ImmA (M78 family)/DNA-binding XRE family transcriptional regulator